MHSLLVRILVQYDFCPTVFLLSSESPVSLHSASLTPLSGYITLLRVIDLHHVPIVFSLNHLTTYIFASSLPDLDPSQSYHVLDLQHREKHLPRIAFDPRGEFVLCPKDLRKDRHEEHLGREMSTLGLYVHQCIENLHLTMIFRTKCFLIVPYLLDLVLVVCSLEVAIKFKVMFYTNKIIQKIKDSNNKNYDISKY